MYVSHVSHYVNKGKINAVCNISYFSYNNRKINNNENINLFYFGKIFKILNIKCYF